jgi:hypothetical protein
MPLPGYANMRGERRLVGTSGSGRSTSAEGDPNAEIVHLRNSLRPYRHMCGIADAPQRVSADLNRVRRSAGGRLHFGQPAYALELSLIAQGPYTEPSAPAYYCKSKLRALGAKVEEDVP